MKYIFLLTCIIIYAPHYLVGQNIYDAIRSNTQIVNGTARFNAMGGATSTLGADFTHASVNPAGIAFYRSSELSLSTALNIHKVNTNYNGSSDQETDVQLNLNSLSFVHSSPASENNIQFTWGFGYNRTGTYHQEYTISGDNPGSSILDEMTYDLNYPHPVLPNEINSIPSLVYGPALAWNTYLIDYDSSGTTPQYYHANPFYEGTQSYRVTVEGYTADYIVSAGANIKNKLFVGASIGFARYKYSVSSVYEEELPAITTNTPLNDFRYRQTLSILGFSTRLRVGAIYRFNDMFRAGIAYHAPHRNGADDTFEYSMNSTFDLSDQYESSTLPGEWNYTIRNTGRLVLGGAITLQKIASFALEYEYTDFSQIKFSQSEDLYDYDFENTEVSSQLRGTHNVRAGAEYRLGMVTFRGGFRYYMSPFSDTQIMGNTYLYSAGIGFRNKNAFFDLTYQLTKRAEQAWMYDPAFVQAADYNLNSHSVLVTVGLKWK